MKSKITAALLTATFASVVSAQVLYWQVNPSVSITGTSTTEGNKWNYASFWKVDSENNATLVTSYTLNTGSSTEVNYVDTTYLSGSTPAYVNYTSDYAGYSFYIELSNYSEATDTNVGVARSTTFDSSSFGNALQDAVNFNANWSSINAVGSSLAFTAIPEPTSGLMLLVGAAILGLRRKRQQI